MCESADTAKGKVDDLNTAIAGLPSEKTIEFNMKMNGSLSNVTGLPCSTGLAYVPYDNFPTLLHTGESVLTKLEAEKWRNGEGEGEEKTPQPVVFNINTTVREKADVDLLLNEMMHRFNLQKKGMG